MRLKYILKKVSVSNLLILSSVGSAGFYFGYKNSGRCENHESHHVSFDKIQFFYFIFFI